MTFHCAVCNQQKAIKVVPLVVENPRYHQPTQVTHIVFNDQSIFKGVMWGLMAFSLSSATLGATVVTIGTLPLLPFSQIPKVAGVTTLCLASMTSSCAENVSYHLGPRKFTVVQ